MCVGAPVSVVFVFFSVISIRKISLARIKHIPTYDSSFMDLYAGVGM